MASYSTQDGRQEFGVGRFAFWKRPVLFVRVGSQVSPLAFFKSDSAAKIAEEWLEQLFVSGRLKLPPMGGGATPGDA